MFNSTLSAAIVATALSFNTSANQGSDGHEQMSGGKPPCTHFYSRNKDGEAKKHSETYCSSQKSSSLDVRAQTYMV